MRQALPDIEIASVSQKVQALQFLEKKESAGRSCWE
jgi:hypothetical protein